MLSNCPAVNTFPIYDSLVVNISIGGFWLLMLIMIFVTFRRNPSQFAMLIMAFIFGYSVEYLGVSQGLYAYLRGFVFLPGCVPIYIPFGWAFIFYSAYITSARLFDHWLHIGLCSGLLAVALDFLMDPGAAGLYLWHWSQQFIPWYGIPWNNFVGWFMIIFCLATAHSFVEQRLKDWGTGITALAGKIALSMLGGYLLIVVLFTGYLFIGKLLAVAQSPLRDTLYNALIFVVAGFPILRALLKRPNTACLKLDLAVLAVPLFIICSSFAYLLVILIYTSPLQHDYYSLLFLFPFLSIGIMMAFYLPYRTPRNTE